MSDPTLPEYEYDDLFVYAPSYLLWERGDLTEGKAVGTAKEADLVLLDKDRTMHAILNPQKFAKERKGGADTGRKKLRAVQEIVEPLLNRFVRYYQRNQIDEAELRKQITATLQKAWKEVFVAGVRASGIPGQGPSKALVSLTTEDQKWMRSAMQHEMRFLNKMLDAIVNETYKMPLPKRIHMYVRTLESFYDSARVIGLPATVSVHWIVPKKDGRVCESCEYLAANSPYSKRTLPTVPRSGLTQCLSNCRDRLLVRVVSQDEALALHESSPARSTHISRLRAIKRRGRRKASQIRL